MNRRASAGGFALIMLFAGCSKSGGGDAGAPTPPKAPSIVTSSPTVTHDPNFPSAPTTAAGPMVSLQGRDYYCEAAFGFNHYDCVVAIGERPAAIYQPDIYCFGVEGLPRCGALWYPDILDDFKQVSFGTNDYICTTPRIGSIDDFDCYEYTGGDPDDAISNFGADLYCSGRVSIDCNEDYYPSEVEGLTFVSIGLGDYVCEETFQGEECYEWNGVGSPRNAVRGFNPDYYCNRGECSEDDYP